MNKRENTILNLLSEHGKMEVSCWRSSWILRSN